MKSRHFLDLLLKTAQRGLGGDGLERLLGQGQNPPPALVQQRDRGLLNADFGKGALTGGALGLLLGNKKMRKLGSKIALYGGAAAVGALAYRAYGDWKRQQGDSVEPRTIQTLPPPEAEHHSQAILKALIAAAKADGHIDAREREAIETQFQRIDPDASLQTWLHAELERPLDPAEVAAAADSPELAAEIYLASLLAADEQSFMEKAYLDELAQQLKLEPGLKQRLEDEARKPPPAPPSP